MPENIEPRLHCMVRVACTTFPRQTKRSATPASWFAARDLGTFVMKRFSIIAIIVLIGCSQDNEVSQQPNKTLEPEAVVASQDDRQAAKPAHTGPETEGGKAAVAANAPSVTEQAIVLLNQGKVEEAERLLRERLQVEGADHDARILLGRVLDFDGRPEEAVTIWKQGIRGGQADFALWMHLGDLRARQGDDGPTLTRRRGTMTAEPNRDKAASAKFKKEHLEMAVDAYSKGVELAPTDAAASAKLAQAQFALGNHAAAIVTWQRLTEQNDQSVEAVVGLAKALHASGKTDEAMAALQKALKLNSRLSEAHTLLAECQRAKGLDAEAEQSTRQAEFFTALPPFTELTFSRRT
jgi:tetratricopeptide (TPR) repeat protein